MRVLLVSSFVLPHSGGVEQFVATIRGMLEERGCVVRLLACRLRGLDCTADAVVPALHLGRTGWPLPAGGWRTLWREVGGADVIVANVSVHPLPIIAILVGRRRGVRGLLVVHGSGQGLKPGGRASGALRIAFQRTLGRLAMRRAIPVSVSVAGLEAITRTYGVRGRHLPYPLPELAMAGSPPAPGPEEPLRVAWIGRLAAEKDPLLAVQALGRLHARRPATLDVYGDGPLRARLAELAATRPWLTLHGARPWAEVLDAQERAHACLSTSAWDNVQVAVLEALARGVPVVSTRVGDAPSYYRQPVLESCCVAPGDAEAAARALDALAASYEPMRRAFAENAGELLAIHRQAPRVLLQLIADAGGRRASR
jgi:glycosyltransferase involved in cell wall biosynthesis